MTDFAADAPSPARIVDRQTGQAHDVDSSRLEEALAARGPTGEPLFELDSPDAAARRERLRTYGGVGGQIASGAAGATMGVPLLGSNIANAADLYAEVTDTAPTNIYRDLREVNPTAYGAGELAGAVAPALLMPATGVATAAEGAGARGLFGLAARGLAAPGMAVESLGTAAEGLLARQFAQGTIRQAVARGVGGGAVEGAIGGLTNAINEDALGSRELTAESLLTDVGLGALLGGASGGLLYGGGATLRNGASRLIRPVRETTSDVLSRSWRAAQGFDLEEGVADLAEAASGRMARASSIVTGGDEDFIRTVTNPRSAAGRRIREDVAGIGQGAGPDGVDRDVYEYATRQILRDVDAAETVSQESLEGWAVKRGLIQDQVSDARVLDQVELARSVAADAAAMGREIEQNLPLYQSGTGAVAKRIRQYADAVTNEIEASAASGRPTREIAADMFEILDQMKRRIGNEIRPLQDNNPLRLSAQGFYDSRIRAPLEDAGMWGEQLATTQRTVNEAYTNHLTWRNNFRRQFLAEGDRDPASAWRRVSEMNSAPTSAFVRQAGTAANDTRERVFRESLAAHAELLERMAENTGMDIEKAARARSGAAAARQAIRNFDEVLSRVKAVNQFRALEGGTGTEQAIAAQALGFFTGGPLGAVAATALARPAMVARGLGALERAAQRTQGRLKGGVAKYVRDALESSRDAIKNRALPAVRRAAAMGRSAAERARVATRRATALVTLSEYEKRAQEAVEVTQDPLALMRRLEEQTAEMHDIAPQTRNAMIQQAVRSAQYLAQRVPPESVPLGSALPTIARRLPPSVPARARFLRYARAVYTPLTIVEDLESGQLTPEGVEVMRDLYPQMHALMIQSAQEALIESARPDDVIPYSARVALGSLMGFESDVSLAPQNVALTQAAIMGQPEPNTPAPTWAPTRSQGDAINALTQGTPLQSQRAESRR